MAGRTIEAPRDKRLASRIQTAKLRGAASRNCEA
jgi:hypothetical protein